MSAHLFACLPFTAGRSPDSEKSVRASDLRPTLNGSQKSAESEKPNAWQLDANSRVNRQDDLLNSSFGPDHEGTLQIS
jgi:hypothetical protein